MEHIKSLTKSWAYQKKLMEEEELQTIENQLLVSKSSEEGFDDRGSREDLGRLHARRKELLIAKEAK